MHFTVISNLATMEVSLLAITNIAFLYNYILSSPSQYTENHKKALNHGKNTSHSGFHNKQSLSAIYYAKRGKKSEPIVGTFQSSSPPWL